MGKKYLLIILFFTTTFLSSCYKVNVILDKQDFDLGSWLLVDRNSVTSSSRGITDNKVLKEYSKKLIVISEENDKGTTCDGVIELYKNGKLINSQEYLSNTRLWQPNSLEKYYSPCKLSFINTLTKNIQNNIIDSIKKRKDSYPIFNLVSPYDSSTVWYFKFSS